jgi:hypothetical protein
MRPVREAWRKPSTRTELSQRAEIAFDPTQKAVDQRNPQASDLKKYVQQRPPFA